MDAVTSAVKHGHTVYVYYDSDPENPQTAYDNVGTVALLDRCRYDFGNERLPYEQLREIVNDPQFISLPVYLYDHGGITISTSAFSCRWDSGQVGIIYTPKAAAIKEWGKKLCTKRVRAAAVKCMEGEIETLDTYLTGAVYGYVVHDADGEEIDLCWGFYGDADDCLKAGLACVPEPKQGELFPE